MSSVARLIKARLQQKGLSVHALEKLSGLKQGSIHNILQGKSKNPTLFTLQAISQALECPLDSLVEQNTLRQEPARTWNAKLYQEATRVVEELSANRQITLSREQAVHYIEEIYNYAILSKQSKVDRVFAQWLFSKQWF